MKARNETAERFQTMVADERLPSIRKNGAYMTGQTVERILTDPDFLIQLATQMKTEHIARLAAEQTITEKQPFIAFAQTCERSTDTILIRELAKIACKEEVSTGEKRFYQKLRELGLIFKDSSEPY